MKMQRYVFYIRDSQASLVTNVSLCNGFTVEVGNREYLGLCLKDCSECLLFVGASCIILGVSRPRIIAFS